MRIFNVFKRDKKVFVCSGCGKEAKDRDLVPFGDEHFCGFDCFSKFIVNCDRDVLLKQDRLDRERMGV